MPFFKALIANITAIDLGFIYSPELRREPCVLLLWKLGFEK